MKNALIGIGFASLIAFVIVIAVNDYKNGDGFFMSYEKYVGHTVKAESVGEIVERAEKTAEKPQFERHTAVTEEAESEQATEEETVSYETDEMVETVPAETSIEETGTVETEERVALLQSTERTAYTVAGFELDREIGDFLKAELTARGIEQWMPYALAQIFQESHFDPTARNKNGLDMGILQYRVTYWDWSRGDIFDWRAQISLYAEQTARRIASGCSIAETISRHNTSDYGSYNQVYVDQVMQWIGRE